MSPSSFAIRVTTILGIVALLMVLGYCGTRKLSVPADWPAVLNLVRKQFPEVPGVSTAALAEHIDRGEELVLLDAREPEEFAVSRIAGARNARTGLEVDAMQISKDAKVITYCSVGYRSAALARELRNAGYRDVTNLEGSIFAWANEGRPLAGPDGEATRNVHPYSEKWGRLIDPAKATPSATAAQ